MSRRHDRRFAAPVAAALAGAVAGALLLPAPTLGHALGSAFTLPVPLWLYLAAAAVAVAASFVVAVVFVKPPVDPPRYPTRPAPEGAVRAVGLALRILGLAWWYGAIVAGFIFGGITLLPAVLFWIGVWVGVPMASALLGNPWPSLSPFRTTYDALDSLVRWLTGGRRLDLGMRIPKLDRWPAVMLLFIFLILELIWPDRLNPVSLASVLVAYTALTLVGMVVFGSVTWLRSFELFEILNGWFGRVGPAGRRTRRTDLCAECTDNCRPDHCVDCAECIAARDGGDQVIDLRWWITGLTERVPGRWSDAAFIILALAGVTFDGLQQTSLGARILAALFTPLSILFGPLAASYLAPTFMLVGLFVLFLTAFAVAVWLTKRTADSAVADVPPLGYLAGTYAPTLLPIAAGYLVAHYLPLVIQGLVWLPDLITDPNALAPLVDWIPTAFVWYLSVGAIVGGHIAAVVLAHRLALRDQAARPIRAGLPLAIRAGLPLVVLMIGYTILSLWIIAQPIVIEPV